MQRKTYVPIHLLEVPGIHALICYSGLIHMTFLPMLLTMCRMQLWLGQKNKQCAQKLKSGSKELNNTTVVHALIWLFPNLMEPKHVLSDTQSN